MVAVIHSSGSIKNALHYNENKVRQKVADFIHSANYPKDTEQLGFSDKINRLERLIKLNQQTRVNSVHISLNFDPSDRLSIDLLKEIADRYMQGIGFDQQPYLVYQHHDSGHPHIHIVTTNIQSDGRRISLHNLGRKFSERTRQEIEKDFHLTEAKSRRAPTSTLKPINVQKIIYGKAETKRAITNVLDHVLPTYKYGSLAELNAVLRQYNVEADRGAPASVIYRNKGLVFRVLDNKGRKIGVPVKASLIYNKPTLLTIEARFDQNGREKQQYKRRVMNAVDFALFKPANRSLSKLIKTLATDNIKVILRQNDEGIVYGITYVDHHTKCIFNGSHLGKQYSANAIQQRMSNKETERQAARQNIHNSIDLAKERIKNNEDRVLKIVNDLIQPEINQHPIESAELQKFKRKRKRKLSQSL